MLETDHLELQENRQEPITRPKLKRLILEYLQKRSRKEILLDKPEDKEPSLAEWDVLSCSEQDGEPVCGCRITAITLASQARDEGSTPFTRSSY